MIIDALIDTQQPTNHQATALGRNLPNLFSSELNECEYFRKANRDLDWCYWLACTS